MKANSSSPTLPPGPWKLPLIGNMHQLVGSLPHHGLRDLAKKYGPLMRLQLGELSMVVVSSATMAKEVMKTHDINFADRPFHLAASIISYNSTDIAFAPYGVYWRQLRKICTMELLSAKRVRSYRSIREKEVSKLIQSISAQEGSTINLSKMVSSFTFATISRAAFGKKCKDEEEFVSLVEETVVAAGGFSVAELYPSVKLLALISGMKAKLEKIHQKVDRIIENIIKEHKARKVIKTTSDDESDEDLVDVLLRVQENGDLEFPLTTDNIKSVIMVSKFMFSAYISCPFFLQFYSQKVNCSSR
ncbi:unnamed protein product [Ilex paraguariensis]|uniref:Uncharacterized protein n=1 Tax=Ilex paraguariensis TaxID=185542 RepID=A0ABC8THX8_9AQUA